MQNTNNATNYEFNNGVEKLNYEEAMQSGMLNRYQYIWGGCVLDTQTGFITKYYQNQYGLAFYDVTYQEVESNELGDPGYNVYLDGYLIGFLKYDMVTFLNYTASSDYWMRGLSMSYSIMFKQQEAARLKAEENKKKAKETWEANYLSNMTEQEKADYKAFFPDSYN